MSKAVVYQHLNKFEGIQREMLLDLREIISNELPIADAIIKYGIPTFSIQGMPVLGFNGYKRHNSLFPYSNAANLNLKKNLLNMGKLRAPYISLYINNSQEYY